MNGNRTRHDLFPLSSPPRESVPCHLVRSRSHSQKIISLYLAATALLELIAFDAFVIEPTWLEISRIRIASPKIPRPVTIAVIADLQTDVIGSYEREVIRTVMAEKPDLILMAGDYVQEDDPGKRRRVHEELRAVLAENRLSAPLGIYAVAGNIDAPDWMDLFKDFPVTASAETRDVNLKDINTRITLLSLGDSQYTRLTTPEGSEFRIALGHYPNFAVGDVRADLLVAGHTHGGQVRLPFIGPIMTLSQVPRSWAAGVTDLGNHRTLIVSRGIGMERGHAPRLRFLCRPELVVIELDPK